ncbi:molybdopterin-dependent oxidoreductase [Actinomadura rudentiformis]|uniref:molybdopterin-dependent oxidoreductase n=1 Tax=Actinomadura rudentiformis TaxID=359158 RepID=UPI0021F4C8FD|nr:molybdopterin-dependent oxidoreductase [Actinomadura rudentiformis]
MGQADRITDLWGIRTPYGPGKDWPVRVDAFLRQGITPEQVERWVPTASILHSSGDALDIAVKDGRMVGVRGRAGDRVNHGRLGPKDLYGWQAGASPDRLTRPLIRVRGELVETDWDTAMDQVVRRSTALLDERGPGSIGFYTTGQLFLDQRQHQADEPPGPPAGLSSAPRPRPQPGNAGEGRPWPALGTTNNDPAWESSGGAPVVAVVT